MWCCERRNQNLKDLNSLSKILVFLPSKTMLSYCLKCRKYTESEKPKFVRTKNGRIILLLKFAVCDSKKSKFIKQQKLLDH